MQASKQDSEHISIVTVVLNDKERIENSLRSVAAQRTHAAEYIVIDGGSTDGTLEVLKKHEDLIDYMRSEPDNGISNAFNKGIRQASGELVGLLNAGDWYEPDALSKVAEMSDLHPDVDVFCGANRFWDRGEAELVCLSNPRILERETSVYHPTVFIRKLAYQKFGLYDETYRYAMDYELLLRFKKLGAKFLAFDGVLANMMLDGISSQNWYQALKEVRRARSKYFSAYNVMFYHLRAIVLNLVARWFKWIGLRSLYVAYWQLRNRHMQNSRQQEV